jgi:pimeloyl-ACP methyl ester carboxylesterase
MPTTSANGIEIWFDTFGSGSDPALLLVPGLGAQAIGFDDEFCERLAAGGHRVIRYDNRDVGLSTHIDAPPADVLAAVTAALAGEPVAAAYTLSDMAADGMALLDALEIGRAHVVGTSMGGMIAQTMAIEHPDRLTSLTSVFSTTGEQGIGAPKPEVLGALLGIMGPVEDRAARIDQGVELARLIGTGWCFDEARARARAERFIDRDDDPEGTGRQMVAILASGSRADALPSVELPTVVIHGDADPLVDVSGGHRTAELVPGAQLVILDRMGHDLPPVYWDQIVDGVRLATASVLD